jgi:hypothetical protein
MPLCSPSELNQSPLTSDNDDDKVNYVKDVDEEEEEALLADP